MLTQRHDDQHTCKRHSDIIEQTAIASIEGYLGIAPRNNSSDYIKAWKIGSYTSLKEEVDATVQAMSVMQKRMQDANRMLDRLDRVLAERIEEDVEESK